MATLNSPCACLTAPVVGVLLALASCCGEETTEGQEKGIQAVTEYWSKAQVQAKMPSDQAMEVLQAVGSGQLAEALERSASLIIAYPSDNSLLFARGVALFQAARFGTAKPLFEQVIRSGPSFVGCERVFYFYGMCQIRLGEPEIARQSLQTLLQILPDDGEGQIGMAELTLQEGEPEAAFELFDAAFQGLQQSGIAQPMRKAVGARAQAGMGKALLQLGRLDEALTTLRASIEADPSQAQPYYSLSRALIQKGEHEQAKRAFDQFQRLSRNH